MDSIKMTTGQQLPEGWKIERLGDIAISEKGKKPKNQSSEKTDTYCYPYVDIEAFEKGVIKSYTDGVKCVLCDEDDFLMVWDGSRSGLVGKGIRGALGSTLVRISLPEVSNLYAYYFLLSKYQEINTRAKGSGTPHVDPDLLWNYAFPIPPNLETQQAIVNKIESLFDEIDEGIGRLKTAAQQIQQYRQSLLKNAFNGELTKEWRSKHADTLPSENELLAQIQTTREQHHAQQLADWQTTVSQWEQNGKEGKKPSKPSTLKKLESIEKLNEIELTALPDGWFWERLGLMTLGVEYGTSAKSQPEGKVPVLRMGNMQNGKIDWTDLVYSDNDEEIKQYSLKKGDVLFNRTNSPELVGKTSIIETDEKAIFAGYLIRINHLTEITDGRYLTYFLNSMIAKKYGNFVKTDGVNQSNINGQKLINYPFVFCSLKEQEEVADILEQKLTACDQLAAELAKQLKQAELLKQAVLKAAFSGSLLDK
jgi:restriction modification system DNA specificity domain protein